MSLPKCKDFTDYNKYPGEENPTTDAQMQEYMDNQNQLMKAASAMMWQPSSEYEVGDIVISPAMPANTEAVCMVAGMTDTVLEPSWTMGSNIPDGSCFWRLRYVHYTSFLATDDDALAGTDTEKIMTPAQTKTAINNTNAATATKLETPRNINGVSFDGTEDITIPTVPTGTVIAFAANSAPTGYLLCNGSAVNRTTYADLFAVIGTTYGDGNGSTTFNLPNLANKFIMGHGTAGTVKSAGLPNVSGSVNFRYFVSETSGDPNDPFLADGNLFRGGALEDGTYNYGRTHQTYKGPMKKLSMSLSNGNSIYGKSTTVQPPAVTMRFYIKY